MAATGRKRYGRVRGSVSNSSWGDSLMSIALLVVTLLVGFPQPPAGASRVVAPGAKLEKVFGEGEFTEGGALAADGSILFSDIGNRILRFDPQAGRTTVFREPSGRAN